MQVRTALFTTAVVIMAAASLSGCAAGVSKPGPARSASRHAAADSATNRSALPGAYLGAMAGPWSGPQIRPPSFELGADWSLVGLKWAHWTDAGAYGHGRYVESASAACPCTRYWAAVTLTDLRNHDGRAYFATMVITARHRKALRLVVNTRLGWWQEK
jgi:hypothetical protein